MLFECLEQRWLLHAGFEHHDDQASYHIHDEYGELFADPVSAFVDVWAVTEELPAPPLAEPLHALTAIPALDSLPGAPVTIYLDFDGHFEPSWGTYGAITTPVYSRDSDYSSFSDTELQSIQQIWAQVSEDFSPFNINVTTVEPPSFANGVAVRVSIGGDGAWTNATYGGLAYVNSFTNLQANTVYVFSENLSGGRPKNVAEASSHEAGHSFGLRHQSQYNSNGDKIAEYYSGPGNGTAPIMGNSYSARRGLWWHGTSTESSTSIQSDLSILVRSVNGITYRADDHGDSPNTATSLQPDIAGIFQATGVLTSLDDRDYFSFDTGSGQVSITITVPEQNNSEPLFELFREGGMHVYSSLPSSNFGVSYSTYLAKDKYYVAVRGAVSYAELGQYTIRVTPVTASASGIAYYDENYNGLLDPEETTTIAGARIYADLNSNGLWDANLQQEFLSHSTPQTTNTSGSSWFPIEVKNLPGFVTDINVRISLQYSALSSLVLTLRSPSGKNYGLMGQNIISGNQLIDTVFDAEATEPYHLGEAPYTGNYRPATDLTKAYGELANGTWLLRVFDTNTGNHGVLEHFSLDISTDVAEPSTLTDAQGAYHLVFPSAGRYMIRQSTIPGYTQTGIARHGHFIQADPAAPPSIKDFGNAPPAVLGRYLFYNNSHFDGNSAELNILDDFAIAIDKKPLLPDEPIASFANISSYSAGLNGVSIDIIGRAPTFSLNDLEFSIGTSNDLSTWQPAPAPSAMRIRFYDGFGFSDRISVAWDSNAVKNAWLQVRIKGNDALGGYNTTSGLTQTDTFYFGSRIGDTGIGWHPTLAITNPLDEIWTRNNPTPNADITNPGDFNRDGRVNPVDQVISRNNTGFLMLLAPSLNLASTSELPEVAFALSLRHPIATTLPTWSTPGAVTQDSYDDCIAKHSLAMDSQVGVFVSPKQDLKAHEMALADFDVAMSLTDDLEEGDESEFFAGVDQFG